jgi:deferrochelatase/peroxidase EfeB
VLFRSISWIQKGMLKAYPRSSTLMIIKIKTHHFDQRAQILERFLSALEKGKNLDENWINML